jgi:uncharacterized membrane protein YfcA
LFDPFFQMIDASPAAYAACSAALVVASATHRITGQAFGLVLAPLVAIAAPSHVPALVLLCGLPVMIYSFKGDWATIQWREISYAFAGRVVGSIAAAAFVAGFADEATIGVSVAVCVLIGVGLSLTRLRVAVSPLSLTVAGTLSGGMATLTSVGAPPMGLLYQNEAFHRARSTLNAFFLFGALASVGALAVYGLIATSDIAFAAALMPAMAVGVLIGDAALARLRIATLRPFVLAVSVSAAVFLIFRAVAA